MAENGENTPVQPGRQEGAQRGRPEERRSGDAVTQWREEVRAQARDTQDDPLQKATLRTKIKNFFAQRRTETDELRQEITRQALQGTSELSHMGRQQRDAQKAIVQVFEGIKEGIIEVEGEHSRAFLGNLEEKLSDAGVTERNAALIYPLVNYALENDVTAEGLESEFQQIAPLLSNLSAEALQHIQEAIYKTAEDGNLGITVEQARERFAYQSEARRPRPQKGEEGPSGIPERHWGVISNYLGDDPKDVEIVQAMYSIPGFLNLVKQIQEKPDVYGDARFEQLSRTYKDNPGQVKEAYWREVSAIIERQMTFAIGKLFRRTATAHKGKFLEEIARENQFESIEMAKGYLFQAIQNLSDKIAGLDKEDRRTLGFSEGSEMMFFSKKVRRFETETRINVEGGGVHTALQDRRIAVSQADRVDASDFLSGIRFQAERFVDNVLVYNHNIQALFLRQAGQDGTFWGQIGQYAAQNLSTFDLDSLNDIPDADKVMAAFRLYSKYVKEDFGRYDWNNRSGRFTEDFSTPNTPIQQDVVRKLKLLFPELADPKNKWRLDQAMNIAIGVSRGVFLTEPTTVAWADAPHKGDGTPTFESYYTNSNAALLGLNPQHNPDRFKVPPMTIGPLMHMPIAGVDKHFMRRWNHIKLFEWMKKREDSYVKGLPAFDIKHPRIEHHGHGGHGHDKGIRGFFSKVSGAGKERYYRKKEKQAEERKKRLLTFIDAMPNIGKVGGPIERGGWRNKAYEGWFVFKADGKPDPIETFKSLENIGFEGVRWWVTDQGLAGKHFTDEFGDYLYAKYIQPQTTGSPSYDEYVASLKKDLGKEGEKGYGAHIVNRGLAFMLRQRVPSLFVAIERTRLTDTGIRAWEKLRRECGWGMGDDTKGADRMDMAMKNIMLVEQQVRQKTSERMKESIHDQLEANPEERPDLRRVQYEQGINDYRLTPERFDRELSALFKDPETGAFKKKDDGTDYRQEYEDAVKLFHATQNYLDEDYMNDFAEKIRTNGQPEKYFPFAIAAEELDTSFLTYKSVGPDVMRRLLGEIGGIESDVSKGILDEFLGKLIHVATAEHKYDTLIHGIEKVHHRLAGLHGEKYANEVADYMARTATAFFKKDWNMEGWAGKIFNLGKPHSLAAEFAGGSWKNVWEWGVEEQDTFYRELDRLGLLPDDPVNLNLAEEIVPRKFLGLTWGYKKVVTEPEPGTPEHTGRKIREDMGGTKTDILKRYLYKYGLPALIGMGFLMLRKAVKEEEESKH